MENRVFWDTETEYLFYLKEFEIESGFSSVSQPT
jgi:hypothetical protein